MAHSHSASPGPNLPRARIRSLCLQPPCLKVETNDDDLRIFCLFSSNIKFYIYSSVCICMWEEHLAPMGVREQLAGVVFLLLPFGFQEMNLHQQAWWLACLPAQSSQWPKYYFIRIFLYLSYFVFIFIWLNFINFLRVSFHILGCFPSLLIF